MKRWYLLYCKKGDLARARMHLENQDVECYYPEAEFEKIVRGKRKRVKEALFSCYMFIWFDYELGPSFTTVRSTRGVVDFVRHGKHPQEVRENLIADLKQLEIELDASVMDELPQKGEEVIIQQGQFSGLPAIYSEPDGEKRSILLIQLLNQTVEVKVSNTDFEQK